MNPKTLYLQVGHLIQSMPSSFPYPLNQDCMLWLGRVSALVDSLGPTVEQAELNYSIKKVSTSNSVRKQESIQKIQLILYKVLALAELRAPPEAQGSFIPAGNALDVLGALSKILGAAQRDLLIVDPYLDHKAFTDYFPLAPVQVSIRALTDSKKHKPTVAAALDAWKKQYLASRPIEVRLANNKIHDRLIVVDGNQVWSLTQSLNAFATNSPALISKVPDEIAALKKESYETFWDEGDFLT